MFDPASVRFRGPLSPHVDGFWSELKRLGYTPYSGESLLRLAAHVSRWLADNRLAVEALTDDGVARFMAHRRRKGYRSFRTSLSLRWLIVYFRRLGILSPPARLVVVETTVDRLVREYAEYLVGERGLATTTVARYTDLARGYLDAETHPRFDVARLRAEHITSFVLRTSRKASIATCKRTVTFLRSFLRFLHVHGEIGHDLAPCVPAVASRRLAGVPKSLEPDQLDLVLRATDPRSVVGRRDGAIVRLLARLGLRAGEVAGLRIDDIDWRIAEIVICGKGRRESRMPLPRDVGQALVAYLRNGRPQSSSRRIFLSVRAPFQPLKTTGVIHIAIRVLRRVGVATGGAHLMRHTAATQMLRHGASLDEIGQVLRHRNVDTTAIYAKVDHAALQTLARRWPGDAL